MYNIKYKRIPLRIRKKFSKVEGLVLDKAALGNSQKPKLVEGIQEELSESIII